ncbi:PTS mannose transporter subunit IIB [Marinilactibacillus sp. 15R]|uniref:PTS system mannose/fructose/sorbose family transporter subunit IID n=1 Tax=Marinilactibacillus sp. 15R TaxID=1911586 RepID=UPI00090AB830|nr:PTS system mannose/fructose/sorbose family transporter subunit IID [Marinilactibacillus sp. 15R]API88712.1 PTS mannose transporter subunit IIB [Marinilactibacillus sp. 15R]
MTSNVEEINVKNSLKLDRSEKKLINKIFWRTAHLMFCTSYTKQQGTTYAWTMIPFLERIYGKETDEFYDRMTEHQTFFNTAPGMAPFIFGLNISMEEENMKNQGTFDTSSIEAIKASLMGPLAGIGDSIFLGTFRIIATAISIGLSQSGSPLGPLLFLLAFNIPNVLIRYYGGVLGYKLGGSYISEAISTGKLSIITKAFSIVGLMMVGAMVANYVNFATTLQTDFAGQEFVLQDILDQIMPGLLPLSLTLGCFWYLRKKNKPTRLLIFIFILGLALTFLGITG